MTKVRGGAVVGFSLRRPVTVGMFFAALVVVGVIARIQIPVELIPSGFTPPFLYVELPTLRSAPTDVERNVAIPVEEMLRTVRNVDSLRTRVDSGSASFFIEFVDGTDMELAYNQVRDRVDRVIPTLGDDIGRYFVWKYNPTDEPILWFAVTFADDVNAAWLIENLAIPKLERIAGVSRVETYGAPDRVVGIEIDDRRAEASGLGLGGLVERLADDNFALSAGSIEDGGARLPLRLTARFGSVDQIRALPIGNGLRLADVATVEVQDRAERAIYRVDQATSVFLAVYKESSANTVEVSRAVRAAVDDDLRDDPRLEGFQYAYFFDQGHLIEGSVRNLEETALWGGALAVVILFAFLRRLGMTLMITLAIPASLLATIVVMFFAGRTLNVLSLTGLMLSVGMVVDNAIVVVESIQARLAQGDPPRHAAFYGAAEVALAVLVATLTSVVAFLPLILMAAGETVSFYLSQIGLPVCVALVASLVVSLAFLPLAAAYGLSARPPATVASVEWITTRYERSLRWAVRRRADATIVALAVFASLFWVRPQVPRTDQTEPNINDFRIFLTIPDEYSWQERVDVLLAHEAALANARDELGIDHLLVRMGGQWGRPQLRAFLVDPDQRALDRDTIIERATALLPPFAGVTFDLDWSSSGGLGDALEVRIVGRDSRVLAQLAEEAARRLRHLDGVTSVRTESGDDGGLEVHFVVDRERALRLGLSAWTVGGALDFALRGRRIESLRAGGEELPIIVEGDVAGSDELDEIRTLELPGPVDGVVLGDVTRSERVAGFGSIDRTDGQTVISLTVLSSRNDLENLRTEVDEVLDAMQWPRGYSRQLAGRFSELEADRRQQNFAIVLAVVFVFLLMGVLFESIVLPLSIILSIPFAFVGVYWALFLTRTSFDMMAGVGVIILVGIVVNNAIVLVDRIGELRREGVDRDEAIALAGRQRLRPIVMTAATTIVGLVPMAAGTSSLVGIPYSPLGRAVIGGLVASTLLTLFVVPLFYAALDDLRTFTTRLATITLRGGSGTAPR